jgi:hypothetical protein
MTDGVVGGGDLPGGTAAGSSRQGCVERVLRSARARFEQRFCAEIMARLTAEVIARLEELVAEHGPVAGEVAGGGRGFFADLKANPDRLGLEMLLEEITKLSRVREIGLPADLFAGYSERLAGPCGGVLPVEPAGQPPTGAADAVGGVVLVADQRDHRRAG